MSKYHPHSLLVKYIRKINDSQRALDLGCGKGDNSIFLRVNGFEVEAIDNNLEALNFLKKNIKRLNLSGKIKLERKDFRKFKFLRNKYSLILAINSLNFLKRSERNKIIKKMKEALLLNGIIIISAFTVKDPSYQKFLSNNKMIEKNTFLHRASKIYWNFFEKNELKNLFNKDFTILFYKEFMTRDQEPIPHDHGFIQLVAKKERPKALSSK